MSLRTSDETRREPSARCTVPRNEPPFVAMRWMSISSSPCRGKKFVERADGVIAEVLVVDGVEEHLLDDVEQIRHLEGEQSIRREQFADAVGHLGETSPSGRRRCSR